MKNIFYSILAVTFITVSCGESATKKINQDNVQATEVQTQANASNSPVMTFSKMSHDFGNINEGDIVTTTFSFTNTGKSDLIIVDARGSCGCTVPEYPQNVNIGPGQKEKLKVRFDTSNKPGKQMKSVTLTTNTNTGKKIIRLSGIVLNN